MRYLYNMGSNTNKGNDMTGSWKILGINDDTHTCELCGKTNLKKVVVLENSETFEEKRVGCDCAGYLICGRKNRKNTAIATARASIISLARKWLAAGRSPACVVQGVGRQGYPCDCKNGVIRIGDFAEIKIN